MKFASLWTSGASGLYAYSILQTFVILPQFFAGTALRTECVRLLPLPRIISGTASFHFSHFSGWQVSGVVAHFSGNRGPFFRVAWIRHFFTLQGLSKTLFSLYLVAIVAHSWPTRGPLTYQPVLLFLRASGGILRLQQIVHSLPTSEPFTRSKLRFLTKYGSNRHWCPFLRQL